MPIRHNRTHAEPQFFPDDDHSKKIFSLPPSKAITTEFLEFLRATGKPHEWRFHLHTKPSPGTIPKIVCRFIIPESLRAKVTKAPCPICSIHHPKYWEGVLVYFEDEKAIRAIGHECGREFFAEGVYEKAEAIYAREQEESVALNFLIENLPKISLLRKEIQNLIPRAKVVDRTRSTMGLVISRRFSKILSKHCSDGYLKFYEDREAHLIGRSGRIKLNSDGEAITHTEKIVVERLPVTGVQALIGLGFSVAALLFSADHILQPLEVDSDDAIFDLLSDWGSANLVEVVSRMRKAWQLAEHAFDLMTQMMNFLDTVNIENINIWGRDMRSPIGVRCRYVAAGRLELGEWKASSRIIPIDPLLTMELPALPKLS